MKLLAVNIMGRKVGNNGSRLSALHEHRHVSSTVGIAMLYSISMGRSQGFNLKDNMLSAEKNERVARLPAHFIRGE